MNGSDKMQVLNLNRMNDALFKHIFTKNPDITISFINSVFEFSGKTLIEDIKFADRELNAEKEGGKESRLDILGRTLDGTTINLEVQVAKQEYMGRRSLYYWSRLYSDLDEGKEYTELKRTVTINILDFNLFDKEAYPNYHSCFGLYDIKTKNQLTTDCELHFLELPKWNLKTIKETNRLERWLSYFSRKTTTKELEEIAMLEPAIKKAVGAEVIFTDDEINRRRYELREKFQRDLKGQISYATKHGFNLGFDKGIEKGIEQGIEQAQKKYLQEEENRAIKLIQKGKSLEDILDFSILSKERVEELFKEYHS